MNVKQRGGGFCATEEGSLSFKIVITVQCLPGVETNFISSECVEIFVLLKIQDLQSIPTRSSTW